MDFEVKTNALHRTFKIIMTDVFWLAFDKIW